MEIIIIRSSIKNEFMLSDSIDIGERNQLEVYYNPFNKRGRLKSLVQEMVPYVSFEGSSTYNNAK